MTHAVFVVIICAVITEALRALPFVCFGGKKGVPRLIAALGETLSPAIMAAAVVALHLWKKNTLLSIGAGTALYMLLIRL